MNTHSSGGHDCCVVGAWLSGDECYPQTDALCTEEGVSFAQLASYPTRLRSIRMQLDVPPQLFEQDFDHRIDVLPVSDPNIFSMAQRMSLAQTQLQLAQSNPEVHNLREAYRRMYEALEVKNVDSFFKPEPEPMPMDPAAEHAYLLRAKRYKHSRVRTTMHTLRLTYSLWLCR